MLLFHLKENIHLKSLLYVNLNFLIINLWWSFKKSLEKNTEDLWNGLNKRFLRAYRTDEVGFIRNQNHSSLPKLNEPEISLQNNAQSTKNSIRLRSSDNKDITSLHSSLCTSKIKAFKKLYNGKFWKYDARRGPNNNCEDIHVKNSIAEFHPITSSRLLPQLRGENDSKQSDEFQAKNSTAFLEHHIAELTQFFDVWLPNFINKILLNGEKTRVHG